MVALGSRNPGPAHNYEVMLERIAWYVIRYIANHMARRK